MPKEVAKTSAAALSSAQAAMQEVKAAVSTLRAKQDELNQRKTKLEQRREMLYDQPLAPADIRQFIGELIDFRAEHYANKVKTTGLMQKLAYPASRYPGKPKRPELAGFGKAPLTLEDVEVALGKPVSCERRGDRLDDPLPVLLRHGEFEFGWHYFFFGDLMKEKLGQLLADEAPEYRGSDANEIGAPIDERRKEIEEINEELRSIASEISSVQSEISSLTGPIMHSAQLMQSADEEAE
ncbi:hypothetical protein [Comamonas resistens]|uniref:hypothetical protein n=1 Tax=Comamonas resistens TaxID=3046670 RepID=UPI0039BD904C